ncbi:MAG: AmpG family muropeptide MFS transporter [Rhodospirillales bacterium]|nr:AmpG family muropeptide MFS transporter [Rhodospirillales bacterium]MBO6787573.1 AmpG family muropeptide MFS transporter [Rhodospirillales bacterium]
MPSRVRGWLEAAAVYLEFRVFLILLLGFSCGLPLLLVYGTLSAWLHDEGVSLTVIGWFSIASSAYALKFVWAPLVDRCPLPVLTPLLGQRRSWLLLSQLSIMAAILMLGTTDPADDLAWTALWAVVLAFASATQDIVVDAYRIEILDEEKMGAGASNYVVGYRIATFVSGAGALVIADQAGWFSAYAVMSGMVAIGIIATLLGTEPAHPDEPRQTAGPSKIEKVAATLRRAVWMPFAEFMSRPHWIVILLFIALYKYGDALLGVMANPFYLAIGFSKTEIGLVTKGFGLAATIIGGIIGGTFVARYGTLKALMFGGILQAASNGVFALQAWIGPELPMLFVTIGIENLTGGIGTIAFVAYLSGLCNVAYTATQFALLSSLMAFTRTVFASGGGWLADQIDWVSYFLLTGLAAIPGLLLLLWLMKRVPLPVAQEARP